jgi:hypothetical protein
VYCLTAGWLKYSKRLNEEPYTGRILRAYTESHLIDHMSRDTGGHLATLQYSTLVSLNHLINVAAYELSEMRLFLLDKIHYGVTNHSVINPVRP